MEARTNINYIRPSSKELTPEEEILLSFDADHNGNAKAVAYLYQGKIKYTDVNQFAVWDGTKWVFDRHAAWTAVTDTLEERRRLAVYAREPEVEAASKGMRANVVGTVSFLEALVKVDQDFFNRDPDHLPAPNGIIDLRTGELKEHDPNMGFTYNTAVDYEPDTDYSWWSNLMLESVGGDEDAAKALQVWSGLCLTGHTRDEKLLYIYGAPRAGKGLYMESFMKVLGTPIAQTKNFETFTAKRDNDTNLFDMASLVEARAVFADEATSYTSLNAAKLKVLTGGGTIETAKKGQQPFPLKMQFKVTLAANPSLNADPEDDAFWGRVITIEFPNSHLGSEDFTLKERCKTEEASKAILTWAVDGAKEWYERGLIVPQSMKDNLKKQRAALDNVSDFLEDCTERVADGFVSSKELTGTYQAWCDENGLTAKQRRGLSQALERRGIKKDMAGPANKRERGYRGIVLKEF